MILKHEDMPPGSGNVPSCESGSHRARDILSSGKRCKISRGERIADKLRTIADTDFKLISRASRVTF